MRSSRIDTYFLGLHSEVDLSFLTPPLWKKAEALLSAFEHIWFEFIHICVIIQGYLPMIILLGIRLWSASLQFAPGCDKANLVVVVVADEYAWHEKKSHAHSCWSAAT